MLKDWFFGSTEDKKAGKAAEDDRAVSEKSAPADKKQAKKEKQAAKLERSEEYRKQLQKSPDPRPNSAKTKNEPRSAEEDAALQRQKLKESVTPYRGNGATGNPAGGGGGVTYDQMFSNVNKLLLAGQQAQESLHDGLSFNVARQMATVQLSTKWSLGGSPMGAGQGPGSWEITCQSNGFADVTAATWSSKGQHALMHHRVFKNGGVGVAQFVIQPAAAAMGMSPNIFFGMLQWPWLGSKGTTGGTTQISYQRGQQIQLSHTAKLFRGLTVGAQLSYEIPMQNTALSFAAHTISVDKTGQWAFQWGVDRAEWRLAHTRIDPYSDLEMMCQLDYAERQGRGPGEGRWLSSMAFGVKKPFIGGACVTAVISGWSRIKALLELPFGGERFGMNQVSVTYGLQFDVKSGSTRHGLTISM